MDTTRRPHARMPRWLTAPLAWLLILGQVSLPVYAQSAPPLLSDVPIAAKVSAKPNIVYTLDDSGSMQLNYIPEYVNDSAPTTNITTMTSAGTTATATLPLTTSLNVGDWITIQGATPAGYNGYWQITSVTVNAANTVITFTIPAALAAANPKGNYTVSSAYCRSGNYTRNCTITLQGNNSFTDPPFFTSDFNRMMYNPNVTYYPPIKETGTYRTNANTDANGNEGYTAAKWTAVDRDAYYAMFGSGVKDNLNTKVAVPLYCNTDWPVTAGVNLALNPDVADANGQYLAGSGAYCRINGTKYDASITSTAPAVQDDYNYPYQSSSGVNGAQYFYRQLGSKVLWCDNTSPWWPRAAGVITSCGPGGTPVMGPATQQKCNAPTAQCNPVPASRNFTPAACKTPDPLYCKPNTGGSDGNSPGTGDVPECQKCTCNADFTPAQGKCSSTGASCSAPYGSLGNNPSCPDIASATIVSCSTGTPVYQYNKLGTVACNSVMWDPSTNAPTSPAITMLQDADGVSPNGLGLVCRHNNQTYATGGVAGLFKYPAPAAGYAGDVTAAGSAGGQLGKFFTQASATGCPTIGTTVNIWRHYYTVDSLQFCDNKNLTVDDQWRGFGTGVCQNKNDLTVYKNIKYGRFHRWDLFATNPVAFPTGRAWLAGASPGPQNSESINYANWYAYYATRLNAAKTTSATAFSYLNNIPPDPIGYRVGFETLGDEPSPYGTGSTNLYWVDVADWDLTQRTAWYNKLFSVTVSTLKTPTLSAMIRVGNLFERGGAAGVDTAKITPLPGAAADPVQLSCQPNYHVLFTDGTTNQVAVPSIGPDQDQNIPGTLAALNATGNGADRSLPTLKLGGAWPAPFQQGTPVSDTLADISTYYWSRDLRDGTYGAALKNDVPNADGRITNNPLTGLPDPDSTGDAAWNPQPKDVAWWQHVNFNAISFGTEGVLDATDSVHQTATLAAIKAGTTKWPDLTQPNNPTHPFGPAAGAVAVDDLWHATVMGRGTFVNAKSPPEVAQGLASILAGIQNGAKARSGAGTAGQVLGASNLIYQGSVQPGWAGDVSKIEIDSTGAPVKVWWSAGAILTSAMTPASSGDEPWNDQSKRRIVTINDSSGAAVAFRWANLSAAQKASLATDPTTQQKMVAYLRGGSTFGSSPVVTIEGTGIGQFRKRFGILGDVSDAQAAIVGPPLRPYVDATDPGYKAYATAQASRSTQIVAAANDGMVHVFDAGPDRPLATGGGTELFAFIPKALFRGTAGNAATEDPTSLLGLTYQDGGVPIYHHHFYVNATPKIADVDFGNGSGDWHTIAVGGLGKGGGSFYALDLSSAAAPDEATAAAKVLWEWTNADVKYSYTRPVIVKVRDSTYPTGRWVVIVASGYNNTSGHGKIFFIDAHTGATINTIDTGAGSGANPAGLAYLHAFVQDESNQVAEQIYGGDLLGNVWRVDVSVADSYKTTTTCGAASACVLFAKLTDGSGTAQPVTTAPQIEVDVNNGIDRYVFVGTGRLLHVDDFTNPTPTQQQTMYAIRDGTVAAPLPSGLPIQPRVTLSPVNADKVSAIAGGAPNGWYEDLPNTAPTAERIVVDPEADVNIVVYIGTQAQNDPCVISLPASLYARDFTTGRSLLDDGTGNGAVGSVAEAEGLVGGMIFGTLDANGNPILRFGGTTETIKFVTWNLLNPVTGPGNRLSWRLLTGQ